MAAFDTDDWEAINDNGFVYKRRKRLTGPTSLTRLPDPEPNPNPNPDLENELKLKKRREILVHVKDKYQKELALWDSLANSFKDFEARVKSRLQHKDSQVQPHAPCNKGSQSFVSVDDSNESLVQELLFKVTHGYFPFQMLSYRDKVV